jgi:CheY-like chemotaxis protein
VEEKKQVFIINIDKNIPAVLLGDDQRLSQVITNLLSNAVKFTPENGTIDLNARLITKAENLCTIQVEIIDSGIGISKEQLLRLFNTFEQADSGTSRKFGGTGLGLAISKSIVEMMGGRIWVESEPGKGSTFAFTSQMRSVEEQSVPAELNQDGAEASPQAEDFSFKGYRILLAEDVDINREIMMTLLEPTGLEMDSAENGAEALRMFSEASGKYDLIFMDVQMPEMDGYEATRRIREFEKTDPGSSKEMGGQVPIIAMTANVFREDIEKCLACGMNGHVGKPLNFDEVLRTLKKYLPKTTEQPGGADRPDGTAGDGTSFASGGVRGRPFK